MFMGANYSTGAVFHVTDASAAEAILSSSELLTRLCGTRLRSKLAIPECIAPGDRERGGVSV